MKADLSQLAIEAELNEGDLILDAILLMRVAHTDKEGTALMVASTPGIDWITQVGIIESARIIMRSPQQDDEDD